MKISNQIEIHNAVHAMRLHPDRTLSVVDIENIVRIYDAEAFKLLSGFKSNVEAGVSYVRNADISPDGKHILFYRGTKRELLLFDVAAKKFLGSVKAHGAGTECVVFSPAGWRRRV